MTPDTNGKDTDMERTELAAERPPRPRPRLASPKRTEPEGTEPGGTEPEVSQPERTESEPIEKRAAPRVPVERRRGRVAARVLVTALTVLLAAAAYAGHAWWETRKLESAHGEAIAAARQLATNFVSISAASVDADLARIAAGATGEFGEEFGRGMPGVRQAVLENKVQSAGTVLRAGLVSGDEDSAIVLVAIDATVKNVKAPDGRISHYRIQLDLARESASGKWLVAKLQFVG
jgi:Mce-associated membrane protein